MSETQTEHLGKRRSKAVPKGAFAATPYFADRAEGAVIFDVDGRELLDFAGGIAVMNVGHCHPKVVEAIQNQAARFTHTCFHVVMYEPYIELAERLCALTPGNFKKMALLANSGAEAVENAVKIARNYTKRSGIIAFEQAFHGRTLLGMSLTSKVKPYKLDFGPFAPEIYRMPYAYCYRCPLGLNYPECGIGCAEALNEFFITHTAAENVAGLIVEPVLGEGGFIVPPPEYFPRLLQICRDNGILFIADEVQTGIGRTGKMFAMEHWGVEPDLVTAAKSLAGGMPLSAIIGRQEVMDAPHVGGLGGTYSGNPVSCAAALAVLDIFEEEALLDRAAIIGRKVRTRFEQWSNDYEIIGDVRGLGAMLAMELVEDRETKKPAPEATGALVKYCWERGLILLSCGTHGNVIRLLMPLVVTDEQLERGLAIMEEGLVALRG